MRSLDFIRGITRPTVVLAVVVGVVGLAVYHGVTLDAKEAALLLAAFGGLPMGFWFNSRETESREHEYDPPVINNAVVNESRGDSAVEVDDINLSGRHS